MAIPGNHLSGGGLFKRFIYSVYCKAYNQDKKTGYNRFSLNWFYTNMYIGKKKSGGDRKKLSLQISLVDLRKKKSLNKLAIIEETMFQNSNMIFE